MTEPTSPAPAPEANAAQPRPWRPIAAVAGVFAFIVLAFALSENLEPRPEDPFEAVELRQLKAELAESPKDDALKQRIRQMDRDLREHFFDRRDANKTGAYLLLTGLVLFILAVRKDKARRPALPDVPAAVELPDDRGRNARIGRIVLTLLGLLMVGGSIAVIEKLDRDDDYGLGPSPDAASNDAKPDVAPIPPPPPPPPTFPTREELLAEWPAFRGPEGSGIAKNAKCVESWDGKSGKNVLWKVPVPVPGASSPVIWGDRIWLTSADKRREVVLCYSLATGDLLWQKTMTVSGKRPEPPDVLEKKLGFAAATAVTDGHRVAAIFANGFVGCFDRDGKQLWAQNIGPFEDHYGHASSLAFHRDKLLLQIDEMGEDAEKAHLIALDFVTGKEVWKVERPVEISWSSPIVARIGDKDMAILCAPPYAMAYDAATGDELWRADCLAGEGTPSAVAAGGRVYAVHMDTALNAIRADGKGDVTETHIDWIYEDYLPDVTSPVCDGERVLIVSTDGYVSCIDVADGGLLWELEIEAEFYASPSLAGNLLFATTKKGVTHVLRLAADKAADPEKLPTADLGEGVFASFAFAGDTIVIRGHEHLYAIGKRE